MSIAPPPKADYGFYNTYLSLAPQTELIAAFHENQEAVEQLIDGLSEDQLLYRYDTGKWNIKETLAYLIDAERNFCYRAMRISRSDQKPLPPFNPHEFAINAFATERNIANIMDELSINRKSTIAMFAGMHHIMLDRTWPARDVIISVRALGYAIVGHSLHHMNILKERYLQKK